MNLPSHQRRVLLIAGAICLVSGSLQLLPIETQQLLRYDRAQFFSQGWRLVSGQLLHLGWIHLGLNLAALVLITLLFITEFDVKRYLTAVLAGGIAVNIGLYCFSPEIHWYVGLSGLLHGLFAAGGLYLIRQQPRFALLMLLGILAKVIYEQFSAQSVGTEALIGGKVAFDAHLYGLIGGAVAASGGLLVEKFNR